MDIEFNNGKELYERLIPALNTKVEELKRSDLDYIKAEDIWNYLKENKWENQSGLELCDMVDDILNTDNTLIVEYCLKKEKENK
jgi:hypothetical protein